MATFTPIRPKARPSSVERRAAAERSMWEEEDNSHQRVLQEGLAELEFRVDLEPHMDPVARLGYSPDKAKASFRNLNVAGLHVEAQGGRPEGFPIPEDHPAQRFTDSTFRFGDVMVTQEYLDKGDVWAHEFRHRGMGIIRNSITREEATERWDEETARLLFDEEEEVVVNTADLEKDVEGYERDEELHNASKHLSPQQRRAYIELMNQAALDVLSDQGRPLPTEQEEAVGWLRSLFGRN